MELPSLEVGNWTLSFSEVTGRVLDTSKRSETRFSGGGGASYNVGGQQRTDPVHISSTVTTKHEFWINEEGTGREWAIQLAGADVPLRVGQRITVVSATATRGSRERHANNVLLANHDAGLYWRLRHDLAHYLFAANVQRFLWWVGTPVLMFFFPYALAAVVDLRSYLVLNALRLVPLVFAVWRYRKIPKSKHIDAHLDKLGSAVLRDGERQAQP